MNVYQRPLFRQAGGPIQQAPMAPQMAGPEAAIGRAEAEASAGMEKVGLDYLAQTMGGIDAATDAKGLIDALRGNNKPLEARYAELAQLVGEQDAMQTPESVLALVQPAIMMTEQGAVDSGIGQLMQDVAGQVEMETEEGAPTQMAGGVGSLMMAGAPAAMEAGQQPVQNFRYGGLVQRFKVGGEAQGRLGQLYSEMLPVYQSVLGPGGSEEAKAQALFAIAQAAGQFAAGRGPQGEDLRGASPAAAFASNLGGLSGSLQQQAAARGQEERALRLAALQGAQQEYSAERAAARAAAGRERGIGEAYEAVDAEGNVIAMEFLADRAGLEAFKAANPGATIRKAREESTDFETTTLYGPDGRPVSFLTSSAKGRAEAEAALGGGFSTVPPPAPGEQVVLLNSQNPEDSVVVEAGTTEYNQALRMGFRTAEDIEAQRKLTTPETPSGEPINFRMPDGTVITVRSDSPRVEEIMGQGGIRVSTAGAPAKNLLTDLDIMEAYGASTLDPETTLQVQQAIADQSRLVFNPETGRNERPTLTPVILQAEEARRARGDTTAITFPEEQGPVANTDEGVRRIEEYAGAAFGTGPFLLNLANKTAAILDLSAPFPVQQEGVNLVISLNEAAKLAFRDMTTGRPAQDAVDQFAANFPVPEQILGSPSSAASQIRAQIDLWNREMAQSEEALASGILSASDRAVVAMGIRASRDMIRSYEAVLRGIERRDDTTTVDPAQFRRR